MKFIGDIIDEKTGGIFSVSINGKEINLLPKYNTHGVDMIRFIKFLSERYGIEELIK